MTAREQESDLLARCTAAAHMGVGAHDQREANVFRLAAMVLQSRFPAESKRLSHASDAYFVDHPTEKLACADIVRQGWVFSLPRLRDMLSQQLATQR